MMAKKPCGRPLALVLSILVLTPWHQSAHASGGITCATPDSRTSLTVHISLSHDAAGDGVIGVTLSAPAQEANRRFRVTHARVDYQRHALKLSAATNESSAQSMRLEMNRSKGVLQLDHRELKLDCDWGEFS